VSLSVFKQYKVCGVFFKSVNKGTTKPASKEEEEEEEEV